MSEERTHLEDIFRNDIKSVSSLLNKGKNREIVPGPTYRANVVVWFKYGAMTSA